MKPPEITPEYLIMPDKKREIQRYSQMDTLTLAREIERALRGKKLDGIFDAFNGFHELLEILFPSKFRVIPDDENSRSYVTSLFFSERAQRYIDTLKAVLCKKTLSRILEECNDGSYLQQVDYLSKKLAETKISYPTTEFYYTTINPYLEAVFILRVGLDKLCPGIKDSK